jgi:cytochrome c oxidase subunit II
MRAPASLAFLTLLLAACVQRAEEPPPLSSPPPASLPVPAPGVDPFAVEEMIVTENMEEEEIMEEERMIMLHSTNWAFTPSTITLKQGENVSLHLMGIEGNHGIVVPDLGINETISQGEAKTVKISTDTPGTFEFFCNVPCGQGHKEMRGAIVIE